MFSFRVEHWVIGYANGICVVTKQRHFLEAKAKIPNSGDHPKELGTTASGGNKFGFYG